MGLDAVRSDRVLWERIAATFDATRGTPWPAVVEALRALPAGARVVDAGCGNGRHSVAARDLGLRPIGIDFSRPLLASAGVRGVPAALGVLDRLPVRTGAADAVLCVAALHHVRGRAARRAALREFHRVARPGGMLHLTVWARGASAPKAQALMGGDPGDAVVPWRAAGMDEPRFVHFYEPDELVEDVVAEGWTPDVVVRRALGGPEPDNHVVTAHRV